MGGVRMGRDQALAPPPGRPPRELVLDVVVERKTAADLGNSLTDGRYREQKVGLEGTGMDWEHWEGQGGGGIERCEGVEWIGGHWEGLGGTGEIQGNTGGYWGGTGEMLRDTGCYWGILGGTGGVQGCTEGHWGLLEQYWGVLVRYWETLGRC